MAEAFGTAALLSSSVRPGRRAWRRFRANRPAVVGAVVLALLIVFAFVGPLLWTWDHRIHPEIPGDLSPRWSHPFGTSRAGHDLLGQVMRGTRMSLLVGLLAAAVTAALGAVWGSVAGYYRGWVDSVLLRLVDVLLVLPLLVVVLVLGGSGGTRWWQVSLVVGVFGAAGTARVVRGVVLSIRERPFIEAAQSMGMGDVRVLARHVVPHAGGLLVVDATIAATAAVLVEAALSFVGFGIGAPDTSLGLLVANAQTAVTTRPWLFFFPGGFLVGLGLAIQLVGDGLRDAVDPR